MMGCHGHHAVVFALLASLVHAIGGQTDASDAYTAVAVASGKAHACSSSLPLSKLSQEISPIESRSGSFPCSGLPPRTHVRKRYALEPLPA